MAARGSAEADPVAAESEMDDPKNHLQIMEMVHANGIFSQTFSRAEKNPESSIARCLERLNAVPCSKAFMKGSLEFGIRNTLCFAKEKPYTKRINRSPSTDSIAASNSCSDQGSVDSCHYSSNASDSNGGSSPCSPEGTDLSSRAGTPQPMPPIPSALQDSDEDSTDAMDCHHRMAQQCHSVVETEQRTRVSDFCDDNARGFCTGKSPEDTVSAESQQEVDDKCCYLQDSGCSVPNPFQQTKSSPAAVSPLVESFVCSNSVSQLGDHFQSRIPNDGCVQPTAVSNSVVNRSNCSSSELQQCNWTHCDVCVDGDTELVEHIRTKHVQNQIGKESFVCLWSGCKVYNRASCSLSWLERHILSHGGNKPFKCIVDGCTLRFPSQATLQRHVNSHFDSNSNSGGKTGKSREELAKCLKRKKNLKYIKKSASSKTDDFFDANIMEHIRYKLVEMSSLPQLCTDGHPGYMTFYSRVKARRMDESGKVKVLLQWIPEDILPDSWVAESSAEQCKQIPYSMLPAESLPALLGLPPPPPPTKRRRK